MPACFATSCTLNVWIAPPGRTPRTTTARRFEATFAANTNLPDPASTKSAGRPIAGLSAARCQAAAGPLRGCAPGAVTYVARYGKTPRSPLRSVDALADTSNDTRGNS
jgi:hypothetical protein